jgi:hypothetical protein
LYREVVTDDVDKLYLLAGAPAANARINAKAQNIGSIKALFVEYPAIITDDLQGCTCHF